MSPARTEAEFLHDQAELLRTVIGQARALIAVHGTMPVTEQHALIDALAAITVNVAHAARRLEPPVVVLPPGVVRLPVRAVVRAVPDGAA